MAAGGGGCPRTRTGQTSAGRGELYNNLHDTTEKLGSESFQDMVRPDGIGE